MNFLKLLWDIIATFFNARTEVAQEAWDERDWLHLSLNILLMVISAVLGIVIPLFLIYRFRRTIVAILTPVFMLAVLIASFYANSKKTVSSIAPTLQEVQARANEMCFQLEEGIFRLLQELCDYCPGLVLPRSPSSIKTKPHFDITRNLAIIYHFTIGKGNNIVSEDEVKNLLEQLIKQHLQDGDFLLPVSETYTAEDGTIWPGLYVAGVHLFGNPGTQYRIDLCIMDEPEVAYLNVIRNRKKRMATPHDPDFD